MGDPLEDDDAGRARSRRSRSTRRSLGYIEHRQAAGREVRARRRPAPRDPTSAAAGSSSRRFSQASRPRCESRRRRFRARAVVIPFEDDDEAVAIANDTIVRPRGRRLDAEHRPRAPMAERSRPARSGSTLIAPSAPVAVRRLQALGFGRESGLTRDPRILQEKSVWIETTGAERRIPSSIR